MRTSFPPRYHRTNKFWTLYYWIHDLIRYWNVRSPDSSPKTKTKTLTELEKLELKLEGEVRTRKVYEGRGRELEGQIEKWIHLNTSIIEENTELRERIRTLDRTIEELEEKLQRVIFGGERVRVRLEKENRELVAQLKAREVKVKGEVKEEAEEGVGGEGDILESQNKSTDDDDSPPFPSTKD
jgi:hypothetical protein